MPQARSCLVEKERQPPGQRHTAARRVQVRQCIHRPCIAPLRRQEIVRAAASISPSSRASFEVRAASRPSRAAPRPPANEAPPPGRAERLGRAGESCPGCALRAGHPVPPCCGTTGSPSRPCRSSHSRTGAAGPRPKRRAPPGQLGTLPAGTVRSCPAFRQMKGRSRQRKPLQCSNIPMGYAKSTMLRVMRILCHVLPAAVPQALHCKGGTFR